MPKTPSPASDSVVGMIVRFTSGRSVRSFTGESWIRLNFPSGESTIPPRTFSHSWNATSSDANSILISSAPCSNSSSVPKWIRSVISAKMNGMNRCRSKSTSSESRSASSSRSTYPPSAVPRPKRRTNGRP